jgi:hypothetical protein
VSGIHSPLRTWLGYGGEDHQNKQRQGYNARHLSLWTTVTLQHPE